MAERISRPNSKVFTLQGYGGMPEVLQDFQVMDSPAEMAAALASAPPVPGLASYTASASATPPPTTTYQVGITNNFAGNTNAPQLSSKSGIKATVPATGTISLGYMYIDGLGPTAGDIQTIICVYSDSGANTPQTLLGYSDTVTIPDNSAIAWRPYTFSTPITLSKRDPRQPASSRTWAPTRSRAGRRRRGTWGRAPCSGGRTRSTSNS
jgi:hypothetical protein